MPTVHLSISDKLYEELREAAEQYGIQVTDLIKVFIKNDIKFAKQGALTPGAIDADKIKKLEEGLSSLSESFQAMIKMMERQIKVQNAMIKALEEKILNLELAIEELEEKVEKEKPYIEPELIK